MTPAGSGIGAAAEGAAAKGFSVPAAEGITAATGMVSEMRNLLDTIMRNPVYAPTAMIYAGDKIRSMVGKKIGDMEKWSDVVQDATKSESALTKGMAKSIPWLQKYSTHIKVVGGVAAGMAFRIAGAREEIRKMAVDVHRYATVADMPGGSPIETVMRIERQRIKMLWHYGQEFANQYQRTYEQLYTQLGHAGERFSEEERNRFVETVTAMTRVTGVDYANMINRLTTQWRSYGVGAEQALVWTDLVRQSWSEAGLTAQSLNENMETMFNIAQAFQRRGVMPEHAMARSMQMLQAFGQAGFGAQEVSQLSELVGGVLGGRIKDIAPMFRMLQQRGLTEAGSLQEYYEHLAGMSGPEMLQQIRNEMISMARRAGYGGDFSEFGEFESPVEAAAGIHHRVWDPMVQYGETRGIDPLMMLRMFTPEFTAALDTAIDKGDTLETFLEQYSAHLGSATKGAKAFSKSLAKSLADATTLGEALKYLGERGTYILTRVLGERVPTEVAYGVGAVASVLSFLPEVMMPLLIWRLLKKAPTPGAGFGTSGAVTSATAGAKGWGRAGKWAGRLAPPIAGATTMLSAMQDEEISTEEAITRGAATWAGVLAGAKAGTLAFPGKGTVVGGIVGGVGGYFGTDWLSDKIMPSIFGRGDDDLPEIISEHDARRGKKDAHHIVDIRITGPGGERLAEDIRIDLDAFADHERTMHRREIISTGGYLPAT